MDDYYQKHTYCEVCKKPLLSPDNEGNPSGKFAEVRRGVFTFDQFKDDGGDPEFDVKFSRYICEKCYLEDPDLCRFFNKLGLRTR